MAAISDYALLADTRTAAMVALDGSPASRSSSRAPRGSRPVRIGNAAAQQLRLEVYGELLDVLHLARRMDPPGGDGSDAWALQRNLLQFLEFAWTREDRSLWEVRGPARHCTFSKVMAWAAFDRGAKAVQQHGLPGPGQRWRRPVDTIHAQVCREGVDSDRGTFGQVYGGRAVHAALLKLPLVGFVPADDHGCAARWR